LAKLAAIADPHVWNHRAFAGSYEAGLNARCRAAVATFREACAVARAEGCDDLLVLGDVFDGVDPSPQIVRAVRDVLWSAGMRVHVLPGNHDLVSGALGDNSLGPLEKPDLVYVHERPIVVVVPGWEVWFVPHEPGDGAANVAAAASDLAGRSAAAGLDLPCRRLLALHYGVADESTPPYLSRGKDAIQVDDLFDLMGAHEIHATVAGHWHRGRMWSRDEGRAVVQVGGLCPRDFRDAGAEDYGRVVVFDGNRVESHVVPGDRFAVVRSVEQQEEVARLVQPPNRLYLRRVFPAAVADAPTPEGVETEDVPDLVEATVATRSAALAARGKETLDEALAAFVAEMPFAEGVDRDAVLSRCREFLVGAENG
jgi:DNA repair exonuclease SbcCD nuclease subunit